MTATTINTFADIDNSIQDDENTNNTNRALSYLFCSWGEADVMSTYECRDHTQLDTHFSEVCVDAPFDSYTQVTIR
jgi:hypothetical protein